MQHSYRTTKKILLVGNFFVSNGARQVCQELAQRLSQPGYIVHTTSKRSSRMLRLLDMLYTAYVLRHQYQAAHVDVFSGPSFIWAESVAALLYRLKKPFVLTLRGGNLPAFAEKQSARVHRTLSRATAVTTPSRYLLEQMKSYRSDLILLPNPLDVGQYDFRLRSSPQPKLVWLRAFSHIYNPTLAAEVVSLLEDEFPNVSLTMVGPDKGEGILEQFLTKVKALGIEHRVRTVGGVPKSEVPDWLDQGDIFLNTTDFDNTPVSVLEAMACGLPVVSTDVGGIPYLLEHEHDALLVPPQNPEAMTAAIRRVLTEKGLAEQLSRNARAKVEEFDWSAILPQWEALLAKVIEKSEND